MIEILLLIAELGTAPSPPVPTSAPSLVARPAKGLDRAFALGADNLATLPRREPGSNPLARKLWAASVALLAIAAVADAATSRGQYELNPILGRGRFGERQLSIKIGITGGSVAAQAFGTRRWPWMRRVFAIANVATAGALSVVAARNERRR